MKKILTILTITIFISGCAATPTRMATSFKKAAYSIDGINYIPASAVIESYGAGHTWDPVTRKLVIKKSGRKTAFCVGADVALVENRLERMSASVRMHSGKIMIPASFVSSVLEELYGIKKPSSYTGRYAMRTVVIDPGHGGRDPGAISATGIREKDINLAVARKIKSYLQNSGVRVVLTRDSDRFVSLWRRAYIANNNNADFFVSIHANAARYKYATGIEVFYLSDAVDDVARATAAAENAALQYENSSYNATESNSAVATTLWDMLYTENRVESIELAKCVTRGMSETLGVRNRGAKAAKFYVLKGARMPSVLVEVGFLSNREEEINLNDRGYQQRLASAIADGILLYKHRYEKTDGFTRTAEFSR